MTPPARRSATSFLKGGVIVLFVGIIGAVALMALRRPESQKSPQAEQPVQSPDGVNNQPAKPVVTSTAAVPTPTSLATTRLLTWSNFQQRPFSVAAENSDFQWTSEDAMDTNVIRQLAHNEWEYQRMVEENSRIKRRQLVYRKNTAASVMEHSQQTGETVKQLTVPGFDGQELTFTIDRADLEASKQSGTFTGRLVDQPESMVTLAYQFGREAFTVISPEDGTYLQAFPREPGQLIVTSFDPETYLSMPEGEPIITTNTFKTAQ